MKRTLALLLVTLGCSSPATISEPDASTDAPAPDVTANGLTVQTYSSSSSGPIDIQVNSHLVLGPQHALLADGQLLVADAQQVVSMIQASGRTLDTVFLTHAHPDHYAGFAVIKQAFPNASFVTTSDVLADFNASAPGTLAYLDSALGSLVASDLVTPTALTAKSISLDGQTIDVIDLPNPGESAHGAALGLPGGVLVSGDLLYNQVHLYLGECHAAGWQSNVAAVQAMGYSTIYPGHGHAPVDASVFAATSSYIDGALPILHAAETSDAGTSDAGDPRVGVAVSDLESAFPSYGSQYLVGFSASQFIDANKCP